MLAAAKRIPEEAHEASGATTRSPPTSGTVRASFRGEYGQDVVLRGDIERKWLLVKPEAQRADQDESNYGEDSATEELGPLTAFTASEKDGGEATCDHQEVPNSSE